MAVLAGSFQDVSDRLVDVSCIHKWRIRSRESYFPKGLNQRRCEFKNQKEEYETGDASAGHIGANSGKSMAAVHCPVLSPRYFTMYSRSGTSPVLTLSFAGKLLEISDHVSSLLGFLEMEVHVDVGDELIWIGQPFIQTGLIPCNGCLHKRV